MSSNHVVFFSGGLGSWATARRVIDMHGTENTYLLFTDTLIEDEDLYRFIIESAGNFYGIDVSELLNLTKEIPKTHEQMDERKRFLDDLSKKVQSSLPQFIWLNNGKDVWDVFFEKKYLGNSRLAHCSHILKQEIAREYVFNNFLPINTVLYLGIDWMEEHRIKAPRENWKPFKVEFPMCEEPLLTNIDHIKELERIRIKPPRLYGMGFAHNNCGGFCVRAGQGHFANLLKQNRELFLYHEQREREFRKFIQKDVSILRKQRGGVRFNYTLEELRKDIESENKIDENDIGGCGCFVN